MEFGKQHATTHTTDFCPCQLVTDLLRGNWCNGFWPLIMIRVAEDIAKHMQLLRRFLSLAAFPNILYLPIRQFSNFGKQYLIKSATDRDRAFATAGARLLNCFPTGIVACDTLSQFRYECLTCTRKLTESCQLNLVHGDRRELKTFFV